MKDPTLHFLRHREDAILTALRRVIPGDYKAVEEIHHPALSRAGFRFTEARVHKDPLAKPIILLFVGETVTEHREPVSGVLRSRGAWTFVQDPTTGTGAQSVWLLTVTDFPDRFVAGLRDVEGQGAVFMRPLRSGWLVGVQATLLKSIIKNAGRGDI